MAASDRTDRDGRHHVREADARAEGTRLDRDMLDRSESGAPAAGRAVRDLFSTDEIFHRVIATADEEFSRSTRLLFLSGLAAGLVITFSFIGSAALTAQTGSAAVGNLLYPLGFLFVVMGRYQLFTENTLTPVTLVLTRIASLPMLLRVWGVVLAANLTGAALIAFVLAKTGVFDPDTAGAARHLGEHFLELPFGTIFWKGVFAGGIVAGMVWLNHAAREATARVLIVFTLIYTVAAADLAHCIVGASEVLYLVFQGQAAFGQFLGGFLAPAVLGNTAGGVLLVAVLNYAQTRGERFPSRDCGQLELTWDEWLAGRYAGQPAFSKQPASSRNGGDGALRPPVSEEDHAQGSPEAPATLVQYGDFECPTSRRIALAVGRLMQRREGGSSGNAAVRYVWRHLPMSQQHPHAQRAAVASEAAARQGKFWDMHERLLAHQDRLEEADLRHYAREIGLDVDAFARDLGESTLLRRVHSDRRSGIESGVRRTGNLFIGGARYRGDFTPGAIGQALDRQGLELRRELRRQREHAQQREAKG